MEPVSTHKLMTRTLAVIDGGLNLKNATQKPKLLDQLRQAIRTRHYSPKTEKAYVHWIKRFIFFHNKRHPVDMAEPEIGQFLSSLATEGHVSASTQNQALNALLFLYKEILEKNIGLIQGVVRVNRPKRFYRKPSRKRESRQVSLNQLVATLYVTRLQRICSKTDTISERFKNHWGIHPVRYDYGTALLRLCPKIFQG